MNKKPKIDPRLMGAFGALVFVFCCCCPTAYSIINPATRTPTKAPQATATAAIAKTLTQAAQPTATKPTATPSATATRTRMPPTRTAAPVAKNYDHNGDGRVTCDDFATQAEAQEAYNAGYTRLDGSDNDGKACEGKP